MLCLTFSVLRLMLLELERVLLSFSSLRVFMLLSRFKELKHLSESILRALPNVRPSQRASKPSTTSP